MKLYGPSHRVKWIRVNYGCDEAEVIRAEKILHDGGRGMKYILV